MTRMWRGQGLAMCEVCGNAWGPHYCSGVSRKLDTILKQYRKKGLLDDRLEYSISDLIKSEDLTPKEAATLQQLIHQGQRGYKPF